MRALRLASLLGVKSLFGQSRVDRLSDQWRKLSAHPDIVKDLVVLGHLFEPDIDPETGRLYPPDELAARAARKSLVLQLLARGEITQDELHLIRQESTYEE